MLHFARVDSVAQAVQGVPLLVTPLQRLLAVFNGSSCKGELPSGGATQIGSNRAFPIKLKNGLTSPRV
jgi:hypothetical protein